MRGGEGKHGRRGADIDRGLERVAAAMGDRVVPTLVRELEPVSTPSPPPGRVFSLIHNCK